MNPVLGQRIPSNLRKLLTDIGPKDEHYCSKWTDAGSETVTRDGIELPVRGTVNQCEFLAPANESEEGCASADNAGDMTQIVVCGLCLSKPSCYTCPRCNVPYCGLVCYRSASHSVCSEEFYKESVMQELKDMDETEIQGRKRMQDILLKLRHTADGGMESLLETEGSAGVCSEEEKERAQALELLSRLAEIQSRGNGSAEEIEDILTKLKEIGGEGGEQAVDANLGNMDEGTEDGGNLELVDRFSGLDIETMSEEAIWEHLTSLEKDQFTSLVKSGAVGALVPLWRPWWERHEEGEGALVEELVEDTSEQEISLGEGGSTTRQVEDTEGHKGALKEQRRTRSSSCEKAGPESQMLIDNKVKNIDEAAENGGKVTEQVKRKTRNEHKEICKAQRAKPMSSVPPVNPNIPPLSSLSSNPSPLVRYGLVNVLFGYAFSLRLFNGDLGADVTQEFCQMVLALSEALNSGRVFSSLQEALEGGEAAVFAGGYFDRDDPTAPARGVEAAAHIMTGRSRRDAAGYCLAALSQLRLALSQARAALPKGGGDGETRRKYFLAMKKCEFYQAWVIANTQQVPGLAAGLWREHGKREVGRNALEKEKRGVEDSWKKGRGKGVLIEEIC